MRTWCSLRNKKWTVTALGVVALAFFTIYEIIFARLFPFSPIVLGFSRQEYASFIVYHHGQPESSQLAYVSDIVSAEENYHGLPFRSKPEIFLCRDDGEYHRLTGGRARFIATNGRLFVSHRAQTDARQGIIDLRIYVIHEMSHCLLQQHLSVLRSAKMPRWVFEGVAMDCANQVGVGVYPSKAKVYDTVAQGIFCEPADFGTYLSGEKGTALSCPLENKIAFFYSEFGCLVEFIRTSHGAQQYQAFLKDLGESPAFNVDRSFERVFGLKFPEEIARFKNETRKH
jgi:hypothetical protein